MKRHALPLLVLVSFANGPLRAQSAAPVPDPAPPAAPAVPYQKVVEGRTIIADYGPPSRNDPRVCLEFTSNAQVIACAEKFRLDRRRAQ